MKITVLGIRGIPNVQGGVETHAEQLYKRIAELGCEVEALVRSPFVAPQTSMFGKVRVKRLWSPTWVGAEAFVHSLIGVIYAAFKRPDILHIHAIGPAIVTPLARLFGLRVVVTHHGPDYDRDKWSTMAKWVLRLGERVGMRYANKRISISRVIANSIYHKFGCDTELIPNGVVAPVIESGRAQLERFKLERGRYFLQVSRMVPEKRQLELIRGYAQLGKCEWKLVLVGGIDSSAYAKSVVAAAADTPNVILTGFLKGTALGEIYSHAGAFVLPSSHEGLPIAMLEALSYGLPVLASNIPANLEVGLPPDAHFELDDGAALVAGLRRVMERPVSRELREQTMRWIAQKYDWEEIARRTVDVYRSILIDQEARLKVD